MTNQPAPIKRALISVSDKTGLIEFGKALADRGVDLVSTGGTAKGNRIRMFISPSSFGKW